MARVELYGTRLCPYCIRARQLLQQKGVRYQEIPVDSDPDKRREMQQRGGGYTVPQIFINDQSIGGFTDLWSLEQSGELDRLLAANGA